MQVVLVRHGATDWNLQGRCQGSTDLELSEVGIHQAQGIARSLTSEPIQAIYASNLKRAQQTAGFISLHHRLPVLNENDVRELDHGALEGLTFAEIKANHTEFIQKWRTEPAEIQVPGGERLVDVALRAWNGLSRIVERHGANETVVVVSHNFPILGIICRITGTHLNNYRNFHLDPCSMTRLSRNGSDDWQVTLINNQQYKPERSTAR